MKKEVLVQFALVRDESGAIHFEAANHEKDSLAPVHLMMHGIHYTMNQVVFSEMMKKGVKEFLDIGEALQQKWLDTADGKFDEFNKDTYIDSTKDELDETDKKESDDDLISQLLDADRSILITLKGDEMTVSISNVNPNLYRMIALVILKDVIDHTGDNMILLTRHFLNDVESGRLDKFLEQSRGMIQ